PVTLLEGSAQGRISSTDIRSSLAMETASGSTSSMQDWHELVPTSTIALLEELRAAGALGERDL
ncbi:MAG: hypothetical protein WCP26_13125, partial [Actinomycetes bacterium]